MNIEDLFKWLPLLMNAVTEGQKLISQVIENLKQDAELTPEQDAELDAYIAQLKASSPWQVQD